MKKHQTGWLVSGFFLLCGIILFVLSQTRPSGTAANAATPFVSGKLFVSPDGNWALIDPFTEEGETLLYSLAQDRVVKRFAPGYSVPFVGGHCWSHDSERFLLVFYSDGSKSTTYEVWQTNANKPKKHRIAGDPQGLKVLLSCDGRYVAAEVDHGVLVWDVTTDTSTLIEISDEDLIDLYELTWIASKQLLLRFGNQKPRLALVEATTGKMQFLSHQIEGPVKFSSCAESIRAMPVLLPSFQSTAFFDATTGTFSKLSKVSSDDLTEAAGSSRGVRDLGQSGESNPQYWYWSFTEHLTLRRLKSPGVLELAKFDLKHGSAVSFFQTSTSSEPSVDQQGRVWVWNGTGVIQIGEMR